MATALALATFRDQALEKVREKVLAGRRLGLEDGVALYESHDLLAVGQLANHVREQRHGDAAYFVWNTHVNHTNVCVATCDFCAFAARPGEERGYTMKLEEIFANVAGLPRQVREVHIVGGLHPSRTSRTCCGASRRSGPTSTSRRSRPWRCSSSTGSTGRAWTRCSPS
jgi:2-iminoacetate synthase ThiH